MLASVVTSIQQLMRVAIVSQGQLEYAFNLMSPKMSIRYSLSTYNTAVINVTFSASKRQQHMPYEFCIEKHVWIHFDSEHEGNASLYIIILY